MSKYPIGFFSTDEVYKLSDGAKKLVVECGAVRQNEKVLIITDLAQDVSIAYAIMKATLDVGAIPVMTIMDVRSFPGEEPPSQISQAMLASDVIFQSTSTIMIYTQAKIDACARGARFLAMTGITPDVLLSPALTQVDFKKQAELVRRLTERLNKAKRAKITTLAGTNLELSLEGRQAVANPGFVSGPGDFSGTPDIECYIAPVENSVNGIAIIDGTVASSGLVDSSIKIHVTNGVARQIEGGKHAEALRNRLRDQNDSSVYQVAELGIGLNPKAQLRGAIIEDEGVLGTFHIALGDNTRFGGVNRAPLHIDLVQRDPTIELDGEVIIRKREIFF